MVVLFRYASSLRNDYSYYRFFLLHFMAIAFPETQSDRRRFRWIFFARKLADSNRLFSLERTKMAVLSRVKQGHQWRHSHQPSRLRSYANELHRLACHLHKLGKKKPSTTVAFYYDRECSLVSVFFCPRNFFGSFFLLFFFWVGRTFFSFVTGAGCGFPAELITRESADFRSGRRPLLTAETTVFVRFSCCCCCCCCCCSLHFSTSVSTSFRLSPWPFYFRFGFFLISENVRDCSVLIWLRGRDWCLHWSQLFYNERWTLIGWCRSKKILQRIWTHFFCNFHFESLCDSLNLLFFGVHKVSFFFFMGPLGAIKATNVETCYHSINKHKRTFSRTHEPVQQERGRGRGWWAWPGPRSRFYRVVTEFSRWFLLIEPRMAWT